MFDSFVTYNRRAGNRRLQRCVCVCLDFCARNVFQQLGLRYATASKTPTSDGRREHISGKLWTYERFANGCSDQCLFTGIRKRTPFTQNTEYNSTSCDLFNFYFLLWACFIKPLHQQWRKLIGLTAPATQAGLIADAPTSLIYSVNWILMWAAQYTGALNTLGFRNIMWSLTQNLGSTSVILVKTF